MAPRSGGRQRETLRRALEQLQSQFVFELADLQADRRSGDMKLIGGLDEAAVTRGRPEYFQSIQGGETVGSCRH
jgi:hypothetical protein